MVTRGKLSQLDEHVMEKKMIELILKDMTRPCRYCIESIMIMHAKQGEGHSFALLGLGIFNKMDITWGSLLDLFNLFLSKPSHF